MMYLDKPRTEQVKIYVGIVIIYHALPPYLRALSVLNVERYVSHISCCNNGQFHTYNVDSFIHDGVIKSTTRIIAMYVLRA